MFNSDLNFQALANLVPDLLWCNDPQGNTLWYNQRWLEYTGQTFDEACGYGWLDAIHPDERDRSLSNFQNAVAQGQPLRQEHRIRSALGEYRWFSVRAEPQTDESGRILNWFGAATDIHDRRIDHERQLYDSEERLRKIIEHLPVGAVFVVDRDLRYLLAEGEALHSAGFTPEAMVGKTIYEVIPPELVAEHEELYQMGFAGESFVREHNAHGTTYISRGTPLYSSSGEIDTVLAVSYDITERKQTEAALATELENTRLLHDLSTRLVTESDIQVLYDEIMATAIALTRADAGTVQILDEATQDLLLLTTQGFERTMFEHFYRVNASSNTPCGKTLATGDRALIDFDVSASEDLDGSMRMHVDAGYLSAQSTPLISRSGKSIGMFSTHWREHHRPTERQLQFLDLLARQAADLIEQRQIQTDLRASQARLATDLLRMRRLYNLYAKLAIGLDLKTALDEILAIACEFTHTERGCIQLVSNDGTRLEMFTWRGYSDDSPFINYFRYEGFNEGCDRARVARQR